MRLSKRRWNKGWLREADGPIRSSKQTVAHPIDPLKRHGLGIRPLRQQRNTVAHHRDRRLRPQGLAHQCRYHLAQAFFCRSARYLAAAKTSSSIARVVRIEFIALHQKSNTVLDAKPVQGTSTTQACGGSTRPTVAGTWAGSITPASSSCIKIMLTSVGTDGRPVSIT